MATAMGWGLAAFLGSISVLLLQLNADAADPAEVRLPLWHFGAALAVALTAGFLGHALVRGWSPPGRRTGSPPAPSGWTCRGTGAPGGRGVPVRGRCCWPAW
ncbi:hypothetical protein SJI45_21385 [Streptomyces sp. S399]|uniref:hypothetical protein n=1 Tax=Streptomyces sp. S399 TaxID=3096009 RepID=UPI002A805E77|nr:hypothetical protein [Streptomyces sp. S399]WPR53226.1 hypothetical protein SJI45_21385 [Streptomyces sp. S399]